MKTQSLAKFWYFSIGAGLGCIFKFLLVSGRAGGRGCMCVSREGFNAEVFQGKVSGWCTKYTVSLLIHRNHWLCLVEIPFKPALRQVNEILTFNTNS